MFEEKIGEICDSIMYVAKNFGALYISVDIDVLDPAFAPGTGYKEAGGMSTRELLYFLQRLRKLKNLFERENYLILLCFMDLKQY